MKTIGLLGGMSWESTLEYYRLINQGVVRRLGGLHSARILLNSVDFGPVEKMMRQGEWQGIGELLAESSVALEKAGADFLLICTNTMHKLAAAVSAEITIPLLHIADAAAEALKQQGFGTIGLLGTAFTMEEDFYTGHLENVHGIKVLVPCRSDRVIVNSVIFDELCCGRIEESSRRQYLRIIETLQGEGAEGIVLGCTEIAMLVNQQDVAVKLFDTTRLHAEKAVEWALAD